LKIINLLKKKEIGGKIVFEKTLLNYAARPGLEPGDF
jgi:hypothetical protein